MGKVRGSFRYLVPVALLALAVGASLASAASRPRAVTVGARTAVVAWSAPSGARSEVRYRRTGARRWHVRRVARARRLTLRRLRVDARYTVQVRTCRRGRGCSRWSRALRFRTRVRAGGPGGGGPGSGAGPAVGTGGCGVFPADNPWNRDVSDLPVHPRSNAYIDAISASGGNQRVHPDFGSNPDYGIPYVVVPADQRRVPIRFTDYGDESDPGPYPIPLDAPREAGSDHHVIALQRGSCRLYELFGAEREGDGWRAASGAVFDLGSNALRPDGWTSADAAGLPILPGLVRRDEVATGRIAHALRFTVSRTQRAYMHPATHYASSSTDPNLPPMGLRLRLKASYDISGFRGASRVVLEALRRYGMLLADNGSNWYVSGATDTGWDDEDLNQLKTVPGRAFEAVDTGEPVRTR